MLIMLFSTFNVASAQDFTPESLLVTLFIDGQAQIEYGLNTDDTAATMSVPLFGKIFDQLIVVDDENQLVENRVEGNNLVIDTFGASNVLITYNTSDLVNKTGRLWTFSINSTIDLTIKLPADSTIIGLNQIPKNIKPDPAGNHTLLVMPLGFTEVSYVIGALGTFEHANAAISDAEKAISSVKAEGVIVSAAETKLAEASDAFRGAKYSDAEKLAKEAEALANAARQNSKEAALAMDGAKSSIEEGLRKDISMTEAQQILARAETEYGNGNYGQSLALAQQAKSVAINALNVEPSNPSNQLYIYAAAVGAAAAGAGATLYIRGRKRSTIEQMERVEHTVKEKRIIDLNKIFTEKQYLRQEDKDAINYLAEKGGEAFESEIREKFQLPKTTVWRLVKRLEREDLVEVKKAGGQNLIRIREEFTRTEEGQQ